MAGARRSNAAEDSETHSPGKGPTMSQPKLNPQQRTMQALALRQLEAVSETLRTLRNATTEQADVEAVSDAAGSVASADDILRRWFGTDPGAGE